MVSKKIQYSPLFRWVLDSGQSLCCVGFSVREHRLLPILLVERQELLNLGFFVSLPQLPVRIRESDNASDGNDCSEASGQSFRSELADHRSESYAALYTSGKYPVDVCSGNSKEGKENGANL